MGNCFQKNKQVDKNNEVSNNDSHNHVQPKRQDDDLMEDERILMEVRNKKGNYMQCHEQLNGQYFVHQEEVLNNTTQKNPNLNHGYKTDMSCKVDILIGADLNESGQKFAHAQLMKGVTENIIRYQSHPLPTPNQSIQAHYQKTNVLPLPKLDASLKFNEASKNCQATRIPSETLTSCVLPMPRSESEILSSPYLKAFSFDHLRKATMNFCEDSLLGEGGFGCVYKGWLDEETVTTSRPGSGFPVAIKKLTPYGYQGHNEWLSEVNYLGRLRHPNLVKLIGCCIDGDDRILVYEFMPAGSLENHLFKKNSPPLSWATRMKIALSTAHGLCFLHDSKSPVIYRDFKTSNILLDSEFNAKLSDFGLAKAGPTELQSHVTTRVMGTEGYCDPHYWTTGKLTVKCDVYSFGVVLLELLTGRRSIDESKCEQEKNLVHWVALHLHDNGKIFRIMDTKLGGQYCKKAAYIAANIALRCVHHEPKYWPPMTYIVEILENLPSQKTNNVKSTM